MNKDPRPGRTARLAREVAEQRRLRAPAPIGWDASKAEPGPLARAEAAISAQQARERLAAEVERLGGTTTVQVLGGTLDTVRNIFVAEDYGHAQQMAREAAASEPQAPQQRAGEPQGINWSAVRLDASGEWTEWIDAPPGGWGECPVLSWSGWEARGVDWETSGEKTAESDLNWRHSFAIRIKLRPASDTEGLPVGAVVRGWSPRDGGLVGYYKWTGAHWGSCWETPEKASMEGDAPTIWLNQPGARYLPVNLAEGGV